MDNTITLNQNAAECVKSAYYLGYTKHHNICSGVVTEVAWGSLDWLMLLPAAGLVAFLGLICLVLWNMRPGAGEK